MKKHYFAILVLLCLTTGAFKRNPGKTTMTTSIHFKNWVGDKALVLFDETYTNGFGEPFVISKFRYYISNISFIDAGNKETIIPNSYYLVNEADSLSKTIQLTTETPVQSISFIVGVDSIKNTGGVQTGSLDPANGMFWTWNSGYVFAKLEGQSDISSAPAHSFNWDIGGFRQKENALRKVTLTIGQAASVAHNIVINADVLKWFNAVHPLKIADAPVCHQPGKLAMQVADNYSHMFSVAP